MSEGTGMAQAALDAIKLRLIGCDGRPWHSSHDRRRVVSGVESKQSRAVLCDDGTMHVGRGSPVLFSAAGAVTNDTVDFVVHAPADVDALLQEVDYQRARADGLSAKLADAVAQLQATKSQLENARKQMAHVSSVLRAFRDALGAV